MPTVPDDRILDAALACFGRCGYRGTSMGRIAEAAGVSRPTVYQRYKGKEPIFRAVGARMLEAALADAEAAAGRDAPLPERLHGVLLAKFRLVVGTVGGDVRAEVLTDAASIAGDLLHAFHQRLHAILTRLVGDATGREGDAGGEPERIPAADLALLLLDATAGIEQEDAPPEILDVRLRQLVDLTVRALREPR